MAKSAEKARLPGQALDLDVVSDGEMGADDEVEHVPASGKRKGEAGASPTKRAAPETQEGIAAAMLKALFAEQTSELKSSYRSEMQQAIKACESRLVRTVDEVKENLGAQIKAGQDALAKMEAKHDSFKTRLANLEKGPQRGGQSADRDPALVFGGWRPDTKKSLILSDLNAVIKDVQMDEQLDGSPWVPAVRHSIAILEFHARQGENADGVRRRMLAIIAAVNGAKVQSENTVDNKFIWATISRPRSERGAGYHCGKVRKLLYQLDIGVAEAECAYSSGSLWLKDKLVASVEKVANHMRVKRGKLEHSWLDTELVAALTGKKKEDIEAAWEGIVDN